MLYFCFFFLSCVRDDAYDMSPINASIVFSPNRGLIHLSLFKSF